MDEVFRADPQGDRNRRLGDIGQQVLHAVVVDDGPRFDGAIAQLVAKYPNHYAPMPPQGPVIQIDITDVRMWRSS